MCIVYRGSVIIYPISFMEERENKKLGTILNYAIIVCIAAILIMIICGIVGKFLDKKTNRIGEFSERHPRLNMVIAYIPDRLCGGSSGKVRRAEAGLR